MSSFEDDGLVMEELVPNEERGEVFLPDDVSTENSISELKIEEEEEEEENTFRHTLKC